MTIKAKTIPMKSGANVGIIIVTYALSETNDNVNDL